MNGLSFKFFLFLKNASVVTNERQQAMQYWAIRTIMALSVLRSKPEQLPMLAKDSWRQFEQSMAERKSQKICSFYFQT